MYRMTLRAVAALPALVALMPYVVLAQNRGLPSQIVPCNGVDCGCQHLVTLAQNLINTGIFIAIFLSAMLFAYAGWLYLTQETIESHHKAINLFRNVLIGLIIILSAWLVVDTLMRGTLRDNIVWNNICASLKL